MSFWYSLPLEFWFLWNFGTASAAVWLACRDLQQGRRIRPFLAMLMAGWSASLGVMALVQATV